MTNKQETKAIKQRTAGQRKADELCELIRARNTFIWIVTPEEFRVKPLIFEGAAAAKYETHFWDIVSGFTDLSGKQEFGGRGEGDPDAALNFIRERRGSEDSPSRGVWVMCDFSPWLAPPVGLVTQRRLRNLIEWMPQQPWHSAQTIIVLSPSAEVPAELADEVKILEWPSPDRTEIAELLDAQVEMLPPQYREKAVNGARDIVIDAAVGLSHAEAQSTFARSLIATKTIDPKMVAQEKKRIVSKSGVLEWVDSEPGGLDAVGGNENLKAWLKRIKVAFTPEARDYGLPAPKGCLIVGVPGTGKSLCAKAIGEEWSVPVVKLDLGGLRSKFVGESEANLRKAFARIEALGFCVVWIDEIEKALAGSTGEQGDGGVAADALGALLNWMQERKGQAFVIATANNAEKLPPELLRKGRFDEVWWVGLPNRVERQAVVSAAMRKHGRTAEGLDLETLADATNTFTGAEIAALVPDALFTSFADGQREPTTDDLLEAAGNVVPLARTAEEKIRKLQEFWLGRARPASKPESGSAPSGSAGARRDGRQLDLG